MNLADIISRHAAARPEAPAVVERGRTWNYREFDAAIWRAASWLRRHDIAPGDVIGVTLPDSALHMVAGYALARMGAVQLTLSTRESTETRAKLAKRYRAAAVLGTEPAARLEGVLLLPPEPSWLEPGNTAPDAALRVPGGEACWKIVFTSGTTGSPKAVAQTHAMHLAWRELNQAAVPLSPDERFLAVVPLDFFAGFRICMDVHWAGGATVVGESFSHVVEFLHALERLAISYLYLTPLHLQQILASMAEDRPRLHGLRRLRTGSMVVSEELRRRVLRRLTPNLVVAYGNNEVGSPFTVAGGESLERYPDSIGFPSPGVELEVVDDEDRSLPAGETGQIRIRAPAMPRAYIDNPEASARAFRDGWYYTGDLGMRSAEGALYFKGRADDLMNYDGIKIYPSEIEAALLSHPAVAEAAAFGVPSPEHQNVPMAAVTRRASLSAAELRAWCDNKLGTRAPQRIAVLHTLPRTPAGKIDKPRLVQLMLQKLDHGRRH